MQTGHTLPHPRPCAAKRTGILGHMGHTVVHVVGARPNVMKAAPVVAARLAEPEQVAGLARDIVAGGFKVPDAPPPLCDGPPASGSAR